jgi:hypothetical protein
VSIAPNGSVNIRTNTNNSAIEAGFGTITANVFHSVKIAQNNNDIKLYVDGDLKSSNTGVGGVFAFNQLFRNFTAVNGDGITANFKAWSDDELVIDMPLIKYLPNPNIIENKAKPLGPEVPHGVIPDKFISGGSGVLSQSVSGSKTTDWIPVEGGKLYLVASNGTSTRSSWQYTTDGGTSAYFGGVTIGVVTSSNGMVLIPEDATHIRVYFSLGGVDTATDISIRKAEGWGQYINPLNEDWGGSPFELQWNGDWHSRDLSLISGTDVLGDNSNPEFSPTVLNIVQHKTYLLSARFASYSGTSDAGWSSNGSTGVPQSAPFRMALPNIGDSVGGEFMCLSTSDIVMYGRGTSHSSFVNILGKEVLKSP